MMISSRAIATLCGATLLSLGLLAIAAPAQAQENTAGLRGTITMQDGRPIFEAKITLTHVPSGTKRISISNRVGAYVFSGQRVGGPYTLIIEEPSYETQTIEGIRLSLGKFRKISVPMVGLADASDIEVIEITSVGIARRTSSQTVIGLDQLEGLPAVGRDPKSYVRLVPEAVIDGDFDQVSISGTNNRYNSVTVDGIRQDDDFGLNNNGYPTQRSPVSIEAIEEVAVNLSPFDVRYGGFLGGNINMVTKSGTNTVRGSFFTSYTSDVLTGDRSQQQDIDLDFNEFSYGMTLGGPIVENRVHYFVALDGLRGNTPNDIGPAGSGAINETSKISEEDVVAVRRIARKVYDFDAGVATESIDETDLKLLSKIDFTITDEHRLSASYQRSFGNKVRPGSFRTDRLYLTSSWYDKQETLQAFSLRLFSDWSTSFNTELELGGKIVDTRQVPLNGRDFASMYAQTADGGRVYFGPDPNRHANRLDNDLFHVKLKADLLVSGLGVDHLISAGLEYEQLYIDNLYVYGSRGVASYASLLDLEQQRPKSLSYTNTLTHNASDARAKWSSAIGTFYLQDEMEFGPDFSAQIGVRTEIYGATSNITRNKKFVERNGFANTATLNGRVVIMPRWAATYAASPQLSLRWGGGLYSGGTPNVWVSNTYTNDGVTVDNVYIDGREEPGTTLLQGFDGRTIPDGVKEKLKAGDGDVDALDPNFRIPSSWKTSAGLDYVFDIEGLGDNYRLGINYIFTKVQYAAVWRDLRRDNEALGEGNTPLGTLPDGRPYYDFFTKRSLRNDKPSYSYGNRRFDSNRGYDLLLTNTPAGYGHSLSFSLNKRFDFGLNFYGAYAYQDVQEVSPANSSTSRSNYGKAAVGLDPNHPGLGSSVYQRKHRLIAVASYSGNFFDELATGITLFWESRPGQPYSWTFGGPDDRNLARIFGESSAFSSRRRQLFYVPKRDDPGVILDGIDPEEFDAFLRKTGLSKYRGRIAPRNAFNSEWIHRLDLRFSQEVKNPFDDHRLRLLVDIQNLTNLLNNKWGRYEQVGFPYMVNPVDVAVNENGQYVYSNLRDLKKDPIERVSTLGSLWKAQVSLIYDF